MCATPRRLGLRQPERMSGVLATHVTLRIGPAASSYRCSHAFPILAGPAQEERWLVHNALGGGAAQRMAVTDPARGLVPWVGIAAALVATPNQLAAPGKPGSAGASEPSDSLTISGGAAGPGRAFCFLPLPIATGLPSGVHVNGYFELSSNRRDIWCAHGGECAFSNTLIVRTTVFAPSRLISALYHCVSIDSLRRACQRSKHSAALCHAT